MNYVILDLIYDVCFSPYMRLCLCDYLSISVLRVCVCVCVCRCTLMPLSMYDVPEGNLKY